MPDIEEKNIEQQEPNVPADTGADVEELKSMISAMNAQLEALKSELQRKEPEPKKPADFAAYFSEYMYGKKV